MAMLWLSISASAYDFEADGIYYLADVSDMTAKVTSGDNPYEGDLVIPETTSYKGREFVVTSIESQTFQNCTNLESVVLPKYMANIGTEAFKNCSSLQSINIPQNVTNLPPGCFRECASLYSIDMQSCSQLEHIDEACFKGCSSLETIDLPSSIVEIGAECFSDCVSLATIIIPDEVNSIGAMAFSGCQNLVSITLPHTIKTLSKELFYNCTKLAGFNIPNSVVVIEDGVLKNCSALTSISIPSAVVEIKNEVFNGCSNLREVRFEDNNDPIILGYGRSKEDGTPRGIFNGIPVEKLYLGRDLSYSTKDECIVTNLAYGQIYEGYAPFVYCDLTEVVISNSVSQINPFTFYGCEKLEQIEIPNSVKSIGICAFARSGIISFTVQNGFSDLSMGVTKNGNLTTIFMECPNMKIIKIGRNLVVSDNPADNLRIPNLWGTLFPPSIADIELGNNVEELSFLLLDDGVIHNSLSHYNNLQTLKIGCCIAEIPKLSNNLQLKTLTISSPTPIKADDSFSNSQYMDLEVNIPLGFKKSYEESEWWNKFWDLREVHNLLSDVILHENKIYGIIEGEKIGLLKTPYGLEGKVTIPQNINYNGNNYKIITIGKAFKNNLLIKELDIQACIEKLDADCFKGCSELETIKLSDGLIQILSGAFYDCVSLSNLTIPNTVESIGEYSFYNCQSFKTLSIPASIVSFGAHAFEKCKINSLVFEDGEVALDFPNGPSSRITIFDRGMSQSTYLSTSEGYFWDTSIKRLYIGRNLTDHVIERKGLTYYRYDDPFYSTKNLETLIIGPNVIRIGSDSYMEEPKDPSYPYAPYKIENNRSFHNCNYLDSVKVTTIVPPLGAKFSGNSYKYGDLFVPAGTEDIFKTAEGWKEFKNIFDGTESILVDEITLNVNELSLEIGDTYQLTAEVLPEDATDQTILWESSNSDIVKVDEKGLLTALSEGTSTITAKSADGNCEVSCLVTVTSEVGSVDAIGSCPRGVYIIYNLQGIKILESEDVDKVKQLPSGVYIVNGKKLIIK